LIKAAFITQHENFPWRRQLPGGQSSFKGVEFFAPIDETEVIFVYDALPENKITPKKQALRVFIASEPENVKRYKPAFLSQFDAVITADRETPHPNRIFVQAGLPWHVGSMYASGKFLDSPLTFEDLEKHEPRKTKLVSVVSSDKAFTKEHRARLAFMAKLKAELGSQVDIYGRGINDFSDKRNVLDAYRYHIALENCAIKDYWTEKIADPYLTLTFPIYHGCPNIEDYFPEKSLQKINIYEPDKAVEIIKDVIGSDLAQRNIDQLREARRRVMNEHNVFELLAKVAKEITAAKNNPVNRHGKAIHQENYFVPFMIRLRLGLQHRIGQLPLLREIIRALRHQLAPIKRKAKHYWKLWTNEFYRSHQKWIANNPKDELRYDYNLPSGANILDIGGYMGDFAARFVKKYDANVTVFEPISTFAAQIEQRFEGDKRVRVYRAGLSDKDKSVDFDLNADASSEFLSDGGNKVQVRLWDAHKFLKQSETKEWHLTKVNIEGGEYSLLRQLIDTGHIKNIQYLQVQFHLNVPKARKRYKKLAKRLQQTHKLQWRFPFVWESWERRH